MARKKYQMILTFEADPEGEDFLEFKNNILSGDAKDEMNNGQEEDEMKALTITLEEVK
jgi:hypothetical protein